jgi:hypothetical protein
MAVHLADVEFTSGDTAAAIAHIEDILPWTRAYGSRDFLCGVLGNLAAYYNAAGNLAGARAAAADVLRDSGGRSPDGIFSALAIEHAALTFALSGDPVRAATLAGYAEAACRRHGYERDGTESAMRTRLSAVLAARLTADEREQHAAAGERLRPSAAVALAMDTACES